MRCDRLLRFTVWVMLLLLCLLMHTSLALAAETATKPPIADALIDPDRTRVPEGKLTIAVHVTLTQVVESTGNPGNHGL